jgi:hypothetical protein
MSAPFVVSIAVDAVITALGAFLQPFGGEGCPIIRGQQNRVSPPSQDPFIKLTEILIVDLSTPIVLSDPANSQVVITGPARIDVQVDFYGPTAGDLCKAVKGVYRSAYAVAQFPAGIAPLYCDDGRQSPLIDAEQQYEARWTMTASLQYNPSVAIPQQSATVATVTIEPAIL